MNAAQPRRSPAMLVVGIVTTVIGATGLLTAVVFLLVGGVFGVVFPLVFGTPMHDLQLNRRGVPCSGELIAVETDTSMAVNSRPTVRLRYLYEPGGPTREGDILVKDIDPLAALPVGSPLTVEFLPDDPDVSRIQGGKVAIAGWAGAFGLGFGVFGLLATAGNLVLVLLGAGLVVFGARKVGRTL
jgi:hypothetical protein